MTQQDRLHQAIERERRAAEALRENLRRRKRQQQSRHSTSDSLDESKEDAAP